MARSKKADMQTIRHKKQPYYDDIFKGYGESLATPRSCLKDFDSVSWSDNLTGIFKDNILMVDVDSQREADILIKVLTELKVGCYYQYTTNGVHVFFKQDSYMNIGKVEKKLTALGISIDIISRNGATQLVKTLDDDHMKEAEKNSQEGHYYCSLIGNVENRPIYALNDGGIPVYPYWLRIVNTTLNLYGMSDGDGRNEALYNYILPLQRVGLSKDEIRQTIILTNKFVLGEPLKEKELRVILRDEAFPSNDEVIYYKGPNDKKAVFHYKDAAKLFAKRLGIVNVDNMLFYNLDGHLESCNLDVVERDIYNYLSNPTKNVINEIAYGIKQVVPVKTVSNRKAIPFKNGVYDFSKGDFVDQEGNDLYFNYIPHDYNKNAETQPIVDKFLNDISCYKVENKKLLLQMIGYCLYPINPLGKMFFLDGKTKNGKSTLFNFIKYAIGECNISNLSIQNLADKFGVGAISRKLINIGDDVPNEYLADTSTIKKLVTGETVLVEKKFQDKEPLNYTGKLLFSGNGIPKFSGVGADAVIQRFIIIPMNAYFGDNPDMNLKDKLHTPTNAEYLLKLAVEALNDVLENGFAETDESKAAREELHDEVDPIRIWYKENENSIDGRRTNEVFLNYSTWCVTGNYKPMTLTSFSRHLKDFGYKTQVKKANKANDYKSYRVYVKG